MSHSIPPNNDVTDTAPAPAAATQPSANQQSANQPTAKLEVPDNSPCEQAAGTEPVRSHAEQAPEQFAPKAAAAEGGSEARGPEVQASAADPSASDEQSLPPQPRREQPKVPRRRAPFLPDHAAVLDMLRRVMIATMQGSLAREDAREIRATADLYLKHLSTSSKTDKSRAGVDLAGLRNFATNNPTLLDILAPLLSEEELAEVVVGGGDPAMG